MKREIKFRAWDKTKHRMFGVDQLAFGPDGELVSIYSDGPDFSNDSEALMGEKPDLNDAVLMEYTGLCDKNGREIYESDILKDKGNKLWLCIYEKNMCGWAITKMNEYGGYGYYIENANTQKVRERKLIIVGNIHEGS